MRWHPKRVLTCILLFSILGMLLLTTLDIQEKIYGAHYFGDAFRRHEEPKLLRHIQGYKSRRLSLWPTGLNETDDRIPAQMEYVPDAVTSHPGKSKLILVYTGLGRVKPGRAQFYLDQCPVKQCELTDHRKRGPEADAILFQNSMTRPSWTKPQNQIWIMFYLESPENTAPLFSVQPMINWTATYRRDSTIVTPYERWTPKVTQTSHSDAPLKNYALNKTRKVAWFVSNCAVQNGREEYVKELKKYIDVDIYGACGKLQCPRRQSKECNMVLKKNYKFYLAFENSNCKDYITEKLYWNAYLNDVIPIVMGARPIDYKLACPPNSYIHVDDFESPKELADYLHKLDQNDKLYNEYFRWKGTGSFINTKFWCRLCAMMHEDSRNSWYSDVNEWWRGGSTCVKRRKGMKWATWRGEDTSLPSLDQQVYGPHNASSVMLNFTRTGMRYGLRPGKGATVKRSFGVKKRAG